VDEELNILFILFFLSSHLLLIRSQLLVFWFIEAVSQTTLATVVSVEVASHKNSSTTFI
jgi:hypothetical protein